MVLKPLKTAYKQLKKINNYEKTYLLPYGNGCSLFYDIV